MDSPFIKVLAVVGAVALLWLLMLGAVAAYDAMSDGGMMGMMDGSDEMRGMMEQMMGGDEEVTRGSASGRGEVRITDFRFEPTDLTVTAGTVVEWTNADSARHTATARDDAFDSGRLEKSESYEMTFDSPGVFEYICDLHPWMEGRINVQ